MKDKILIVGGYGVIGSKIAAILAPRYPERVIVAGRSRSAAEQLAKTLDNGVTAQQINIDEPSSIEAALSGVGVVVSCVDQREHQLLFAAARRGLAYTDITPGLAFWRHIEPLQKIAEQSGARILLGAGLAPGISSVMAGAAAARLGAVDHIESTVLLSVGDQYGPASSSLIFGHLSKRYKVTKEGQEQIVAPFSEGRRLAFPAPLGERMAYLFPFSDAVFYPKTLGVSTSLNRLALDPPWIGRLASMISRFGIAPLLTNGGAGGVVIDALRRRYSTHNYFSVVVEARGPTGEARLSLLGQGQARATAIGAAELCADLCEGVVDKAGVWFPEQVIPHQSFFSRLANFGLLVRG